MNEWIRTNVHGDYCIYYMQLTSNHDYKKPEKKIQEIEVGTDYK